MNTHNIFFTIALLSIINIFMHGMEKASLPKEKKENHLIRDEGYWSHKKDNFLEYTLTDKTSPEHQREDWYTKTKYIAEPWCTISNAGFFMVAHAIKDSYPLSAIALTFAGSASAISHAIPYHSLNIIDRIGARACTVAIAYDTNAYKIECLTAILQNPKKLIPLLATGFVLATDKYIADGANIVKNSNGMIPESMIIQRKSYHKWIHVLWHILAAYTAYTLLTS